MALAKQNLTINFSQGVDTKTDPYQVSVGKFLNLQNSIFLKGGLLQKRNGFGPLAALPPASEVGSNFKFLTTFNGDLTAIGSVIESYSSGYGNWSNKGQIFPMSLSTLPLIRNNTNQSQIDSVVSTNGLVCTVYTDQNPSSLSAKIFRYAVADSSTGQNIIPPTTISTANATYGTPRVFVTSRYFIIVFTSHPSNYELQYFAISIANPTVSTSIGTVTTNYTPTTAVAWDGGVFNDSLYLAFNTSSGVKMSYINPSLVASSSVTVASGSNVASIIGISIDQTYGYIWVNCYNTTGNVIYTLARDRHLNSILVPTVMFTSESYTVLNITGVAQNSQNTVIVEVSNAYSYGSTLPTNFIAENTVTSTGTISNFDIPFRSVGLASKGFIVNLGGVSIGCFLMTYQSAYQNTYFLGTTNGFIFAKLAYQNGGGYLTTGLPSVTMNGTHAYMGYLYKDLIQAVNKNTNVPTGSQIAGIYSQTGLNLVKFDFSLSNVGSAEIGTNLNVTGGFTWAYDGYAATEQGFFLYPDNVSAAWSATGGSMAAKPDGTTNTNAYWYQVTYEWTDNQGNAFRSAPSIPVAVTTTGSGTAGSVVLNIPTLRLTYKTANPVKIVIYRWSVGQQVYYQTTSISSPILNSTNVDSISYTDTVADSSILGNNVLYTTGGVVEDIGGPSFKNLFLFDDRLWGITSEDNNLLWYSKQVIEATPVEFSDLFTIYVNPNVGAQGPTGPLTCGAAMDDKLVLFKASAINYLNGQGPDNTGANSQYSAPIFITSTIGCSNQQSIVFMPQGLMFEFQSEAGNQIFLLGRDLSTQYIGAAVEKFTKDATVQSAINIPGTNQVRFTMSSGITLMYDYYYGQWGTFVNLPAISSCVYQGLHTYLNDLGAVFQETPGVYLDNSNPVLMSFTTSWINFNQLQAYQRLYSFYILGTYYSPHILNLLINYDYATGWNNTTQQVNITPSNYAPGYGQDLTYGSGNPYGGEGSLENWRIFPTRDRCQAFQITLNEIYDPKYGVTAGAGFTLSGINCVVGYKKGYRAIRADHTAGGNS